MLTDYEIKHLTRVNVGSEFEPERGEARPDRQSAEAPPPLLPATESQVRLPSHQASQGTSKFQKLLIIQSQTMV